MSLGVLPATERIEVFAYGVLWVAGPGLGFAITAAMIDSPNASVYGLAASGTLATALTSALMIGTRSAPPPACVTTLIVSLGLLSTPTEGAIIVGAVTILYVLGAASSWLRFTS